MQNSAGSRRQKNLRTVLPRDGAEDLKYEDPLSLTDNVSNLPNQLNYFTPNITT
jgi:hypothetical protein